MKIMLLLFFGLISLFVLSILIAKIINGQKYKIRSKTGIQKTAYIPLGGTPQYIQIRGQNIANPVILVLHGGPGSNMAYYSYAWQSELEQEYTLVHWDQRGCGNTYYRNKQAPKPTLALLLSDLNELIDHIRLVLGQEKVILMGHSWGTFLGAIYAGAHPEKVAAYLAIGQMLDFKLSEQASAQEAIHLANGVAKPQDAQKIKEGLAHIMAFERFDRPQAMAFMKFRQLKEKYLPPQYGGKMGPYRLFSPYMTWSDFKWMLSFNALIQSNSELYKALLCNEKLSMYNYTLQYKVPVLILAGDQDWTTPYSMAVEYFNRISAPQKELITINGTGHIPFVDRPKEFSQAVVNGLRGILSK